jgi:hypothetical protein
MNVEIGAEAALFPEKEYISRICVAVWHAMGCACGVVGGPAPGPRHAQHHEDAEAPHGGGHHQPPATRHPQGQPPP